MLGRRVVYALVGLYALAVGAAGAGEWWGSCHFPATRTAPVAPAANAYASQRIGMSYPRQPVL